MMRALHNACSRFGLRVAKSAANPPAGSRFVAALFFEPAPPSLDPGAGGRGPTQDERTHPSSRAA